jgi:hypothetical protein
MYSGVNLKDKTTIVTKNYVNSLVSWILAYKEGAYKDYDLMKCDDVNPKFTMEAARSTETFKSLYQFESSHISRHRCLQTFFSFWDINFVQPTVFSIIDSAVGTFPRIFEIVLRTKIKAHN